MLPTLPALHDAVRAPPMLGDLFDIAGQHFDRFRQSRRAVLVERGVEFAPGSPLEGDGFEPSVPRVGNCAHETAAFGHNGISLRPQGANSFAKRPTVRAPFPPPPTLS